MAFTNSQHRMVANWFSRNAPRGALLVGAEWLHVIVVKTIRDVSMKGSAREFNS
jgi:hypothetical protein